MASRGVNKVILIGNLGQDPEVRYMPSGDALVNLRLATSETWKDKNSGEQQERTEWHTVVYFGRLAEVAGQYLRKGSKIYVEGSLRTRKWQDQNGQDRWSTEIRGSEMQMLDTRASGTAGFDQPPAGAPMAASQAPPAAAAPGSGAAAAAPARGTAAAPAPAKPAAQAGFDEDFDDDIPF